MAKRRRWRHFRQRFDPTARMVFRRPTSAVGQRFAVGEPVPVEMDVRVLRKFWNSGRIELRDFTPPVRPTLLTDDKRHELLVAAIGRLVVGEAEHWTSAGKPRVDALEEMVEFDVTSAQRDTAWAAYRSA